MLVHDDLGPVAEIGPNGAWRAIKVGGRRQRRRLRLRPNRQGSGHEGDYDQEVIDSIATPLTAAALAAAPAGMQKQMIGNKLYPTIHKYQPKLAAKLTGMMLEMDNPELLMMLESEAKLEDNIDEVMQQLHQNPKSGCIACGHS